MKILRTLTNVFKSAEPTVKEYCQGFVVLISPILFRIPQNKKQADAIKNDSDLFHKYYNKERIKTIGELLTIVTVVSSIFGGAYGICKAVKIISSIF